MEHPLEPPILKRQVNLPTEDLLDYDKKKQQPSTVEFQVNERLSPLSKLLEPLSPVNNNCRKKIKTLSHKEWELTEPVELPKLCRQSKHEQNEIT